MNGGAPVAGVWRATTAELSVRARGFQASLEKRLPSILLLLNEVEIDTYMEEMPSAILRP
jgi:hypothetical protein